MIIGEIGGYTTHPVTPLWLSLSWRTKKIKRKWQRAKISTEMKNAFDGLINDWKWLKKPLMKIEGISVETYKTRRKRKKKNKTEYPRTMGQLQKEQ